MMGNLLYLALAAGLSTIGALVLWAVRHRPRSMQHQMDAFSRELRALRPPDAIANRAEAHLDRVEPLPIRPRSATGTPSRIAPAAASGGHRPGRHDPTTDRRRSSSES
jgi:hypothetical protein